MNIKSLRVHTVIFSHEGNNHIKNEAHISLKKVREGVEMTNTKRGLTVFIPMNNIIWISYEVDVEKNRVGKSKKKDDD